ncbi:GNAT family N-acetyltransferase [Bradyrhizobium elkanii]|uniref:GNAT family N-acetyltransferase n=1 Tax=Bradyrhizobium elkanii TaxID=29448 RepID=UPI000842028D|nr:GNAT family N-acetyltransferase [Bradyrhizobium elkanii]ODM75708.1 GCN5 family acetyltransferase [Bradyrhizobium elkanii]ODM85940.1 GCN5 family acetyltransferase [Bradyrhizobium elkanii]
MPVPENYAASEHLRDGRRVEIRTLQADDRDDMLAAIGRTSSQSLQRRFFGPKRSFSRKEVDFFMNIDFTNHVALIALADEDEHEVIIGGGRYVVVDPGTAEIAFVTIDDYQGQGVGTLLMHHLLILARRAGLRQLVADVLSENTAMRKIFAKFGFHIRRGGDPQVICLALPL